MNDVWGLLIFFGSGLSLLMAAAGFSSRRIPALQATLYGLIGLLLFEFFLTHPRGFLADMEIRPLQTEVFLIIRCAKFALGPLFYAFYLRLTTYQTPRMRPFLVHFAPLLLTWILSLIYMMTSLTHSPHFETMRTVMGFCTDASLIHLLAYVVFTFFAARAAGDHKTTAMMLAIVAVSTCVVTLLGLYMATGWKFLETGSQAILALAVVVHFLVSAIRPGSLERFGQDSKRKIYQRSALSGVDTDLLGQRLKDLMEQDKLFCDELLSLESLAEKLSVTRNRLSEFINSVFKTSFNMYVNRYRVEEVKRLLVEHPHRSILSHAYAAGFNSKSVFYDAFKRFTGMTPQDYRNMRSGSKPHLPS